MQAEEKANVYGFNRELIGTPRSLQMLNSIPMKNANTQMFEQAHLAMKKRRNIPLAQTAHAIPEEAEENPFGKSANTG